MEEMLRKFPHRKIQEVMGRIAEGFGGGLLLLDPAGNTLLRAGSDCADISCPTSSACRNGRMISIEPFHSAGRGIGSLAVCMSQGCGREVASGIARSLESFLDLEGEIEDLSAEVVRVYEELSLIRKLSGRLGSEMDVDTICRMVLEEADKILSAQTILIMLLEGERKELITRFAMGRDAEFALGFRSTVSSGLVGHVFRQGEPVTVCDIRGDERIRLPFQAKSILCVPLISDLKPVGMVIASDKLSGDEFWSQELKLMAIFASEIGSSLRKAQLYEEFKKLFLSTVEALASAIDAKDPYTYGHSRRVARFSVTICAELGMSKERIRQVELAALLHDIGKIGTPESILQKPGMLNPEEYEKIKEHPAKGAEILSSIAEFKGITPWIRHHHECYDGGGYPDRIAETEIPLEARVVKIADAFDAMTSDRPYRKGLPPEETIKIMDQFSRGHFDPHVLGVFKRCMKKGKIV
jgi:putative nucleotidyltransferase with HDIG domain